jgi:hypothetical protein
MVPRMSWLPSQGARQYLHDQSSQRDRIGRGTELEFRDNCSIKSCDQAVLLKAGPENGGFAGFNPAVPYHERRRIFWFYSCIINVCFNMAQPVTEKKSLKPGTPVIVASVLYNTVQ